MYHDQFVMDGDDFSLGLLCVALYRLHVVAVYIIYYIATSSWEKAVWSFTSLHPLLPSLPLQRLALVVFYTMRGRQQHVDKHVYRGIVKSTCTRLTFCKQGQWSKDPPLQSVKTEKISNRSTSMHYKMILHTPSMHVYMYIHSTPIWHIKGLTILCV